MQYMIIETYKPGKIKEIYARFDEKGRMLPAGVSFLHSWVNETVTVCYQVMEAEKPVQLNQWIDQWKDLVDFEVVPVIHSAEAREKITKPA